MVSRLGSPGGFNADPNIRIPLPDSLKPVQSGLDKVGMSPIFDDLEVRLIRAAEAATPKAKELFWMSISEMNIDDVKAI